MDAFDGLILGAAAAAIGTIVAFKFINRKPQGGAVPYQTSVSSLSARGGAVIVYDDPGLPQNYAPVVQNSPITEAAWNVQPVTYAPGFGPATNQPAEEAVLPI